jgi:D-glycero-D-manno-heptose 1,7-bisphosphate phosphatase
MNKVANPSPASGYKPVVFFDRDGTLNVEKGYISKLSELSLIPGAAESVAKLNRAGIATVLVTNQSGAARGFYPESHIQDLNRRLGSLLLENGAVLDAMYYCPHLSTSTIKQYALECNCRKPRTGMIDIALIEHPDFDRQRAYVVGDKYSDIELAANCGSKGVLVKSGHGLSEIANSHNWKIQPSFIAFSVTEAVGWILQDLTNWKEGDG